MEVSLGTHLGWLPSWEGKGWVHLAGLIVVEQLMPNIFFTNAFMLAGLAALSIPVLIHLLLKRKKKRLRFSTILFFLKQDEQASQRRKLRNWLLLALRLLVFTLLVLAFARPYLPKNAAGGGAEKKRQAIFLLDRSASMQATGTDGQRWAQTKERVQKAISELKPDDRAALIGCATHAEVVSGFAPAATVAKLAAGLTPTFGVSDLAEGLRQATNLVAHSDPTAAFTIYVVSDFQRGACLNLASCPIPQEVELKMIKVGDLLTPNLAIVQFQIDSQEGAKPRAIVSSFSDEENSSATIDFNIDGKLVASHSMSLGPGASTNLEFAVPALSPGWHELKAQLQGKDALALDDVRYAALSIPEPVRVFIVESRRNKKLFEEESFFVVTALDPGKNSTNTIPTSFNLQKFAPEELARQLSPIQGQLPCDLVILPGLKQFTSGAGKALNDFVQAGGGLLLFLGDEVSANRYNTEIRELMPAQLGVVETSPDVESNWRIGDYDTNTMVFAAFRLPNSGDLRIPTFTKRFSMTAADNSSLPALFDDGDPLLAIRAAGRGRVALANTSADTSWNDWPKHKTFVPWLHGVCKYLAQRAARDQMLGTNSFVAGTDIEIELGSAAKNAQFKLQSPGGKEALLTTDAQGWLRDADLFAPGLYSLRDSIGREVRRFAVNVPAQESDLSALSLTDFQQQLARVAPPRETTLAASLYGPASNQKELWRVLLLSVLALLFIEVFVANRTLA